MLAGLSRVEAAEIFRFSLHSGVTGTFPLHSMIYILASKRFIAGFHGIELYAPYVLDPTACSIFLQNAD